ncbi:MAG: hypothetical protein OXF02_04650 [Simkaniaceae bacterium]|nr:hypothetical protein [Simkaniaceae bacterium]
MSCCCCDFKSFFRPRVVAEREEGGVKLLPPEERFPGFSEKERNVALAVEQVLYERPGLLSTRRVERAVFPEEARRESIESEGEGGLYPDEERKFLRVAEECGEWERRTPGAGSGGQATPSRTKGALKNTKGAVL